MSGDVISVDALAVEPPASAAPSVPFLDHSEVAFLVQKQNSGANWFLWIAGLSLVNTIIAFVGGSFGFVVGLGITELVDVVALTLSMEVPDNRAIFMTIALVLDLAILGLFAVFGMLGKRRHLWAFIVGMVLYTLDLALIFYMEMWIGVAFHLYALYNIWQGFQASRTLNGHIKAGHVAPSSIA